MLRIIKIRFEAKYFDEHEVSCMNYSGAVSEIKNIPNYFGSLYF